MDNKPLKIAFNTAYLNQNLLDELNYVIGGYGKPDQTFIYSLNNFVETFILNEHFLFSTFEWDHSNLSKDLLFPDGRPISEILIKKGDMVSFLGHQMYIEGKILYVKPVVENNKEERKICIEEFQKKASKEIMEKYFKHSGFVEFDRKYSYLFSNFGFSGKPNKQYFIAEVNKKPQEILEGLYNSLSENNYQSALPLNGIKAEINFNKSLGVSNQSYKILSELHKQKIEKLNRYTGYKKMDIPPLVPVLLSQCKNINDIPKRLVQLREDFTDLRNSFTKLEEEIENAESLDEQMKIIDNIEKFWNVFSKKYKLKSNRFLYHFWDLKKASEIDKSIENVIDARELGGFLSNLNISSLIGKSISKIHEVYDQKKTLNRFKGLTNMWELFQKSPILENQKKDYERIFNVEIDLKELKKLSHIVNKDLNNSLI